VIITWIALELTFYICLRLLWIPRLARYRPDDAAETMSQHEFDRALDNVLFLVRDEMSALQFWRRVTGVQLQSSNDVPVATVQSYVKSLLFIPPDESKTDGNAYV
jgi:hypothetical protein